MSYANITNPANFQLQDFAQFGFRVITTDFIPVPGEQYRTLYVLQDAVVTATTQKGDDITSKAILAGTLLHGLFNSVSITSGRVLAYAAGRVTAEEIIALYEAYVIALGGTLENTQCAVDTINEDGVDFFADASLVMIPEGYATGVVYGQRPLTSDSQLTFARASTATRVGPDGAIAVVGSNVPRIDYTGGGCGKLLLEPQRTNLITYSEQFDNAAWFGLGVSILANQTQSPNGYVDADLMSGTSSGQHYFGNTSVSLTSSTQYTYSLFVKKKTSSLVQLSAPALLFPSNTFATFNLDTEEITIGSGNPTASMESFSNGWYRLTMTATCSLSASGNIRIAFTNNPSSNIPLFDASGESVYLWGAQLESASYATSYIPTLGSSVTRLADACSKTGISDLIGQTQGTLYFEASALSDEYETDSWISLNDGTSSNRIMVAYYRDPNIVRFLASFDGTSVLDTTITVDDYSQVKKIAISYALNDIVGYINGVQVFTDTNTANKVPSSLTAFSFANESGSVPFFGKVNQTLLFKTRLTNEQLQKLTSL